MERITFKVHPLFILFLFISVYLGLFFELLIYTGVLILHEYAHHFVAKKLGYELNNFVLMPYGASINGTKNFFKPKDEILIALAGPLINIFLGILGLAIWWLFPMAYCYSETFVYANFSLAIFNLLPIFPLDAGRILLIYLKSKVKIEKAIKFMRVFSIIASSIFATLFFISVFYKFNLTLFFIALFMLFSIVDFKSQIYYNYGFIGKNINHLDKPIEIKTFLIGENYLKSDLIKCLSKNYYSKFVILDGKGNIIKNIDEKNLYE